MASFRVGDAYAAVVRLRSRGVAFLDESTVPFELNDDGVSVDGSGTKVAWLQGPDGNVLRVLSLPRRP
ncbi:VOC family protein [Pseudokineococcus sp. 1T1Z-3]|uniref:VOC family protein n=1 Tax=Pseudokineococcus sp. 1T1Z-3 TaxID=3132745 RepID=UPI0030B43490